MPSADPTKFQHGAHTMALVIHNGLQSQTDSPQFEKGSCKRRTEMPVKEIREDTGRVTRRDYIQACNCQRTKLIKKRNNKN